MYISGQHLLLLGIALFHLIMSWGEKESILPPGKLIDVDDRLVHYWVKGTGSTTVVLDHSLGGIESYFLLESIASLTRVCIYDRPGYGWSSPTFQSRCSGEIVRELDLLLTTSKIEPPYILVGDSFGSYNMRLYAHHFPEKVKGLILTDGLHESGMLNMPWVVKAVKYLFISGFVMSVLGSFLGIIRIIGTVGLFEVIKPKLRQFNLKQRQQVKRSFYHYNHWLTMARELINLDRSGHQLKVAKDLGDLPIIGIKSQSFFTPSVFTFFLPIKAINRLRDKMHYSLSLLSSNYTEIIAIKSSHFVWIDQPEIIVRAIEKLL